MCVCVCGDGSAASGEELQDISNFIIMGHTQSGEEKEVGLENIQEFYRKFASECPSGKLHLHEFKRIFGINRNSTEEETAYMEIVFQSFDINKVK